MQQSDELISQAQIIHRGGMFDDVEIFVIRGDCPYKIPK